MLVFDHQALRLLVGDNPIIHRRLLAKFLQNTQQQTQAIQAAYSRHALTEIGRLAHGLKSAARSAGAMQLGQLCEQIEIAGKADDWSAIEQYIPAFETASQEVCSLLESLLANNNPQSPRQRS